MNPREVLAVVVALRQPQADREALAAVVAAMPLAHVEAELARMRRRGRHRPTPSTVCPQCGRTRALRVEGFCSRTCESLARASAAGLDR